MFVQMRLMRNWHECLESMDVQILKMTAINFGRELTSLSKTSMESLTTYQWYRKDENIYTVLPLCFGDSNLHWVHAGLSSLVLLSVPELKRWQRRHNITELLRLVTEALEQAEERVLRFQDRHDKILFQLNSHYISNREMGEALATARTAMDDAIRFAVSLRHMQLKILALYPYGCHDAFATNSEDNSIQ